MRTTLRDRTGFPYTGLYKYIETGERRIPHYIKVNTNMFGLTQINPFPISRLLKDMKMAKLLVDRRIDGVRRDGFPCHSVLPVKFDDDGLKVEIIQCSMVSQTTGCSMIRITDGKGSHHSQLQQNYYSNPHGECSIMKAGTNQYLATVMNNECELAHIVAESGIFLTSAKPLTDDIIEWTVMATNSTYIRNFINRAKNAGYHIVRRVTMDPHTEMRLTARQEEVMSYALENGYYEIPKKITIEDLCRKFDCSKSTLSVIMRSAEKKVLELYLSQGRDSDVE